MDRETSPSMKHILRIWWEYLWRNIVFVIPGSFIVGFITGFIAAIIFDLIGIDEHIGKIVVGTICGLIGLGLSTIPFKMIIGKKIGNFRLVILEDSRTRQVKKYTKRKINIKKRVSG